MEIRLDHLIYSPIPNKGYGVRAWSSEDAVRKAEAVFRGWFSPYEQTIIRPGYELRATARSLEDYLYIARVFMREGLDEVGRSGVVSHIVRIPLDLVFKAKISLESVDRLMYDYIISKGIGLGELEPLTMNVSESATDRDLDYFKSMVDEGKARKILEGISRPHGKVLVIYKGDVWSRIRLAYSLTKVLAVHGVREYMVLTDKPIDNIILEFENLLIVSNKMIPIRQTSDWTVVKVVSDKKEIKLQSIEETLRKIYGEE